MPLFAALAASAYYLILFTNWSSPYHGGSYRGTVFTDAVAVLAVFAGVEIMRTEKSVAIRALAGALGVPLLLVLALMLWYGIRRYAAA